MAAVKPELYSEVSLLKDFPEEGLLAGDVAVLVDIVENELGEAGAVLEIFNAVGDSIAVSSVPLSAISPLSPQQVPSVRTLEKAM